MFLSLECYRGGVGKWRREARSFLSPRPRPARLWKRFAKCFAIAPPWRGKFRGDRSPFPHQACGRAVFGSALPRALPLLRLGCAHGARTKGRGMLRIRQSASKDGAVEEWAGKGLRESLDLSTPKAKQLLLKGSREAPTFHKPLDAKGRLRMHSPFTSHCRAANKGKVSDYRSPFPRRACGLRVFGSAWPSILPMLRLGCAHGARTAKRFARGA